MMARPITAAMATTPITGLFMCPDRTSTSDRSCCSRGAANRTLDAREASAPRKNWATTRGNTPLTPDCELLPMAISKRSTIEPRANDSFIGSRQSRMARVTTRRATSRERMTVNTPDPASPEDHSQAWAMPTAIPPTATTVGTARYRRNAVAATTAAVNSTTNTG